jgi:site-specific recombinase XerD
MSKTNLMAFIDEYISLKEKQVEYGTLKVMVSTRNHLLKFNKRSGKSIDFQDITHPFLNDFLNYLYAEHAHSRNYAAKLVEILKQFMRAAHRRGLHPNLIFQDSDFRVKKTPVFDIALTINDLESIEKVDLHQTSRDYFILGCNTGLRYSDWDKMTKQHIKVINGKQYLCICMQKTSIQVSIPLNLKALEILERYHYQLPKLPANQILNRHLKEICEKANFVELIRKPITRAGDKLTIIVPKWQMIGTHTARRTFVTNAFLNGLDTVLLANLTGHQSEKQLLKYVKIGNLKKSELAAKHPMFA